MDYLKKLINERVELLNKQIMFKDVTVQTEEENKEELKQLTEAKNIFGVVRTLCDCKEHSIKTNYGFEVCTKCGNEFND
jgi:phosphoenolpyruvate synthase/pyruvate phosphate dikinase